MTELRSQKLCTAPVRNRFCFSILQQLSLAIKPYFNQIARRRFHSVSVLPLCCPYRQAHFVCFLPKCWCSHLRLLVWWARFPCWWFQDGRSALLHPSWGFRFEWRGLFFFHHYYSLHVSINLIVQIKNGVKNLEVKVVLDTSPSQRYRVSWISISSLHDVYTVDLHMKMSSMYSVTFPPWYWPVMARPNK